MAISRFITASKIHDGQSWLPEGSVLELTQAGTIVAIHLQSELPEAHVECLEGVICPGFVNAHGHLELAHMKGLIQEGTGLVDFLTAVVQHRFRFSEGEKKEALQEALRVQRDKGIVAIGDIANDTDTLKYRKSAGMHMHTFVECMGFDPAKAQDRFEQASNVYTQFTEASESNMLLRQSIVPHAPYSVTEALFSRISAHQRGSLIAIHNQESKAEEALYTSKSGDMLRLFQALNIDDDLFVPSGRNSLQTYLPWLATDHPLLLVHNTFITPEDINFLKASGRTYCLCLCPNANHYIERRLPDMELLLQHEVPICLGTDSLASNHDLDMIAEMATLQTAFPQISLAQLLRWATLNGARALQMDHLVGRLTAGRQPGLLHLTFRNNDFCAAAAEVNVLYKAGPEASF